MRVLNRNSAEESFAIGSGYKIAQTDCDTNRRERIKCDKDLSYLEQFRSRMKEPDEEICTKNHEVRHCRSSLQIGSSATS